MIKKYSLSIAGHATSITLEPEFWAELQEIARTKGTSVAALIGEVDQARGRSNLSSALRVFVLRSLRVNQTGTENKSNDIRT